MGGHVIWAFQMVAVTLGAALRRQRIRATKIAPAKQGFEIQLFKRKIDQQAVSIFTRQFSVMIDQHVVQRDRAGGVS